MKKRNKNLYVLLIVLSLLLCAVICFLVQLERAVAKGNVHTGEMDQNSETYSWEEYQSLSLEEQDDYFKKFDSVESFEAWMESVKPAEATEPVVKWDKPGKDPDEYTWTEYQTLTPQEQDAFFLWFGSVEAFEEWMDAVTSTSD